MDTPALRDGGGASTTPHDRSSASIAANGAPSAAPAPAAPTAGRRTAPPLPLLAPQSPPPFGAVITCRQAATSAGPSSSQSCRTSTTQPSAGSSRGPRGQGRAPAGLSAGRLWLPLLLAGGPSSARAVDQSQGSTCRIPRACGNLGAAGGERDVLLLPPPLPPSPPPLRCRWGCLGGREAAPPPPRGWGGRGGAGDTVRWCVFCCLCCCIFCVCSCCC